MEPQVFDTKPLMRPQQIEDAKSEIKAAEAKLQSPHIEDKGEVMKQLRRLKKGFEEQAPQAPSSVEEEGRMVSRSNHLLKDILRGMPSQEEMRKSPPGAVDKHMKWERSNKLKILEWKNLQLRLTHGQEREAANLERHRPVGSSLNMDNAFIPGKQFHFGPADAGLPAVFSGEQLAVLEMIDPTIRERIALMSNVQRAAVKDALSAKPSAASIAGKRGVEKREKQKRTLSAAHKEAMRLGREAKKAA